MRLKTLTFAFTALFLGLIARLFYWQIISGQDLALDARLQYQKREFISAPRGNILASDGSFLATTSQGWLLYAQKPDLTESERIVTNKLALLLVDNPKDNDLLLAEAQRLEVLLSKRDIVWVPLKQKLGNDVKKNIEALKLTGIGFESQFVRYYPEASTSAHILGFVGKDESGDDKGYFGLEGYYDLTLKGKEGLLEAERDARGSALLDSDFKHISSISGVDLLTNIDKGIQFVVEKRLREGLEKYGASAGTVIVMDPSNGAIFAIASLPSYDPAKYGQYGDEFFKNTAISDSFEPGSVFKPIVMAGALDSGVVDPDTKCDMCDGPVKVDKYTIETWDKKYFPDSTMTDVIVHSDNVGMTFVGNKLGSDKLYDYLAKFGIGKLTGIDLQGEENSGLREKNSWNIVDLATATFGQGVAVTPIQMIRAIAVIANGGNIVKPQVVDRLVKGGWEEDIEPEIERRVISVEAVDKIKNMMVAAVKNGEAKWIQAKGFKIAGKTGTAQVPVSGHYDEEKTIASFVGFAPADNPKFVMLVTLSDPQTSPWGSETAAPLWFSIARDLFPYLGIQPEN